MNKISFFVGLLILVLIVSGCTGTPSQPADSYVGKIVLESSSGGNYDVWAINADGAGLQNLTNTPDIDEVEPEISFDGSMIAFQELMSRNVFIISSDGSNLRQITNEQALSRETRWTPDGKKLLICSEYLLADNASTSTEAYFFDIAIGEKQYLEECPIQKSPDGKYYYKLSENVLSIYSSSGDKLQEFILGQKEEMLYGAGDWSPDGKRILIEAVTWKPDNYQMPPMNIRVLDVDTGGISDVTDDQFVNQCPSWSPDGKKIAFVSDRLNGEGTLQPFIINLDGTEIRLLTDSYTNCAQWQRSFP
jgi:Tol biopolymer transport system component